MKKFLSDSILITAGGLVNRTKGFIFIPIIVAYIGLDGYGAYTQIIINILTLKAVFSLELGSGFQRFVPGLEGKRKHQALHFYTILFPTLLIGVAGAALLYLLSGWLNDIFLESSYLTALQYSAPILLSGVCYANFSKYLLAVKKFKTYTSYAFCYDLLPYLAFIGSIMYSRDVAQGIFAYLIADVLVTLVMTGHILSLIPIGRFSGPLFKQYFRYSYALSLGSVEGGLLDKVDRYFISYFLGVESVGIYNIIYKICSVSDFITTPIKKQLMSYLANVWDKGHREVSIHAIRQGLLLFLIFGVGLLSFLSFNMDALLGVLLPTTLPELPIAWMVLFIGAGVIAYAAKRFYNLLIHLEKRTTDELRYQTIGLLLNVVFNLVLIPIIGILGAAIATFVSYLMVVLLIEMRYRLALDRDFLWHLLSAVSMAVAVSFAFHHIFYQEAILWLIINALATAITYLGLILLTKQNMLLRLKSSMQDFRKLV